MAHAQKCPICSGEGTVEKDIGHGIGREDLTCHGCGGKGWITIQDNDQQRIPYLKGND